MKLELLFHKNTDLCIDMLESIAHEVGIYESQIIGATNVLCAYIFFTSLYVYHWICGYHQNHPSSISGDPT